VFFWPLLNVADYFILVGHDISILPYLNDLEFETALFQVIGNLLQSIVATALFICVVGFGSLASLIVTIVTTVNVAALGGAFSLSLIPVMGLGIDLSGLLSVDSLSFIPAEPSVVGEHSALAPTAVEVKLPITIIDLSLLVYFFSVAGLLAIIKADSALFLTRVSEAVAQLCVRLKEILIAQASAKAEAFLPLFFSVFFLIFFNNIFGLIPFWFCVTSQLYFTLLLSFSIFLGLTIVGIQMQASRFFLLFVPQNVPVALLPFLVFIEIVSYLSRAISLAVRLFANMVAGHVLLHILMGLCLAIVKGAQNLLVLPIFILFLLVLGAILLLESGIAFLQAYVFVVLCAIYLNDSLNEKAH
jgi:ATP synthase subunit 6